MRDRRGDERGRQRTHADLVAAVADPDGRPTAVGEPVQRGGHGVDVVAAHVAHHPVGRRPEPLDEDDVRDGGRRQLGGEHGGIVADGERHATAPPARSRARPPRSGWSVTKRDGIPDALSAATASAAPTGPSVSGAGGVEPTTKQPVTNATRASAAPAIAVAAARRPPRAASASGSIPRPTSRPASRSNRSIASTETTLTKQQPQRWAAAVDLTR